jgi:hypothetical protein
LSAAAPPPPSTWRVAAYTRWEQLDDELSRLPADKKATADYRIADTRLQEAKQAFEAPYKPNPLKYFYSGARIEQTWSCLHEAERALLMLLDEDALRARIPSIRAALGERDAHDDESRRAQADLTEMEKKTTELGPTERERLRAIRAYADGRSDLEQRDFRAFRNVVLIFTLLLGVLLVIIAVAHALDRSILSLCTSTDAALKGDLCPNGGAKPGRFDVAEIELVGALGGLLAGIIPLAKARRLPGPYSIAVVLTTLKLFTGAATAFLGVLLLQSSDLLPGLSRQRGSHVLAYAAFFGLAQQVLTGLVDRRVGDLTSSSSSSPATGSAASPRR